MKLQEISITNYRSIKDQTIKFEELWWKNCMILLWANEWGKSNILNAINAINDIPNYNNDCNKDAKKLNDSILIKYIFSIDKDEINFDDWFPRSLIDIIELENYSVEIDIWKDSSDDPTCFCFLIRDNPKFSNYVLNETDNSIHEIPDVYEWNEDINEDSIQSLLPWYQLLNKDLLEDLIINQIDSDSVLPKFIMRKSSSRYLINDAVDLNVFKIDPNSSIPLKNIFNISDFSDIKWTIETMCSDHESRKELEAILSERITNYINRIWPEHKIKFAISIESNLMCKVNVIDVDNDKPRFTMDQRSDWFKQFVSILLNLSIENADWSLKNSVILLDEPEVHLHPSWIKYLRDELLKISQNNIVVLSTHSIYMIDHEFLNRHKKIEKIQWETKVIPVDDNPYKEEVIYESLGTSIFEHIKPNVILLEWKTDKDIFDVFTDKFKDEIDPPEISTISTDSVDKMDKYAKFIDWKLVKWFVLLDSDNAWHDMKKKILEIENYNNDNTFEIKDIYKIKIKKTEKKYVELEDLLPLQLILDEVCNYFWVTIPETSINQENLVMDEVFVILKKDPNIKLNKDDKMALKQKICTSVCSEVRDLSANDVKTKYKEYYNFITNYYKKLK